MGRVGFEGLVGCALGEMISWLLEMGGWKLGGGRSDPLVNLSRRAWGGNLRVCQKASHLKRTGL